MKKFLLSILLSVLILGSSIHAFSQDLLLKGVVKWSDGSAINGRYDVTLKLYIHDDKTDSYIVALEKDYSDLDIVKSVVILPINEISDSLINQSLTKYSITIEGEEAFMRFRPTLYSLRSRTADSAQSVEFENIKGFPSLDSIEGTINTDTQLEDGSIQPEKLASIPADKIIGDVSIQKDISLDKPDSDVTFTIKNKTANTESSSGLDVIVNKDRDKGTFRAGKDTSGKTNLTIGTTTDTEISIIHNSKSVASISDDKTTFVHDVQANTFKGSFEGDGSKLTNVSETALTTTLVDKINDTYSKTESYNKSEIDSKFLMKDESFSLNQIPDLQNTYANKSDLSFGGSNSATSGASKIGVYDEFNHSDSITVQEVFDDLDDAISKRVAPDDSRLTDSRYPKVDGQVNGDMMYFRDGEWRSFSGSEGDIIMYESGYPVAIDPVYLPQSPADALSQVQADNIKANKLSDGSKPWEQKLGISDTAANANTLDGLDSTHFKNASNINTGTLSDSRLSSSITKLGNTIDNNEISSLDYNKLTNTPSLGSMANQNKNAVEIDGGDIKNVSLETKETVKVKNLEVENITYVAPPTGEDSVGMSIFGNYKFDLVKNRTYESESDGFALLHLHPGMYNHGRMIVYISTNKSDVDELNEESIIAVTDASDNRGAMVYNASLMIPIKKGYFWRVESSEEVNITYIPLGLSK